MGKTTFTLLLITLLISSASATTYDIVCNVDGAKCYIDDEYIGVIFSNHLYYLATYDSETPLKTLRVVGENGSAEVLLNYNSWDDYEIKRIVVSIESGLYPPMGTLNIQTMPAGATIYFQDEYLEKGPYTKIGETGEDDPYALTTFQGYHRIKIWLDGYEPIWDRIYVYGDDEFDNCYYLEYVGEHTNPPDLGPDPTPSPTPTPTPKIIIQEKEVIKEVQVVQMVEKEILPSIWVIIISLVIGGGIAICIYKNKQKIPRINLPKPAPKKKKTKSNENFWDDD
jgi:hypothetical protein